MPRERTTPPPNGPWPLVEGDTVRNVHTGEVVPVLHVADDGFVVPSGRRKRYTHQPNPPQTWPWTTFGLDWTRS